MTKADAVSGVADARVSASAFAPPDRLRGSRAIVRDRRASSRQLCRRKCVRIGCFHVGYAGLSAEIYTSMKLPAAVGRPLGASIVVVVLCVSDSGRVCPVALSNSAHEAR